MCGGYIPVIHRRYVCVTTPRPPSTPPHPLASDFPPLQSSVDAFVACGGHPDETGFADVNKIVKIVKTDFGLDVDIEGIIDTLDVDGAGQLGFAQFKEMLTAS